MHWVLAVPPGPTGRRCLWLVVCDTAERRAAIAANTPGQDITVAWHQHVQTEDERGGEQPTGMLNAVMWRQHPSDTRYWLVEPEQGNAGGN